jgi:hypothetical protein
VVVKDGDTVEERWAWMQAEQERKHAAYLASPECAERNRLAKIEAEKCDAERAEIRAMAGTRMNLRDTDGWKKSVDANTDGYGGAVMTFAERWACYMEAELAIGKTIAECANRCSHLADEEGITGFMYGCAVSTLAAVWVHGDALRRWHNKETQIGTEGDQANESGGVLNSALLSIG